MRPLLTPILLCFTCNPSVVTFAQARQASPGRILSATYGLAGCLGVPDTKNVTDLRARGCAVTADGGTSARSVAQMHIFCGTQHLRNVRDADGLPVTFSAPMQPSSVKPEHFQFLLNNGSTVHAICVNAAPANEGNEIQTFATIGYFGDGWKDTVYPVRVTIVGDSLFADGTSARGLSFNISQEQRFVTNSPFLVQAELQAFSTEGEANFVPGFKAIYPNHCKHLYGSAVTHRVRVVLNGGATVDGVHAVAPNQTGVFELLDATGTRVTSPILGLADLGSHATGVVGSYKDDGDNFFDVCLDSSKGAVEAIETVRMPCSAVRLVLPKGKPKCRDNSITISHSKTN